MKKERQIPKTRYSSFHITVEGLRLLDLLARAEGLRRTAIIEMSIRERAERKGVK